MKLLIQSIFGHRSPLLRGLNRRYFAASTEEYAKRNYANNVSEYNTVVGSITAQRRHFLLRDVYDDMMLDGIQPTRDTFHSLIVGTMKGSRLHDAFYFREQMKGMGLVPDVRETFFFSSKLDFVSFDLELVNSMVESECMLFLFLFLMRQLSFHLIEDDCEKSSERLLVYMPDTNYLLQSILSIFTVVANCPDELTPNNDMLLALLVKLLEEMKIYEVKPNGQTYVCLLNACAAAGRLDRVRAIVRDMTAAGAGLNKFCYAGLITVHMNKTPVSDDTATKIIEFVEQSKGWSSADSSNYNAENVMMGVTEEELYNLPTADYVNRRGGFLTRQLTVYHVALHACAELRNVQAMETLLEMLKKDGKYPDVFIVMQTMRCYLRSGDIDNGLRTFEEYMNSGKTPAIELYTTLVDGAMIGYTPKGMQIAQDTLVNMNSRNFFLSPKLGSDLLLVAAGEKTGGYTTANYIWDLMQARKITPSFPAVEAYYNGLKEREIPSDDPRLLLVSRTYDNLRLRIGGGQRQ
ncbi:pentatricopeptide repeat-containing protein At4g35850, mitochondrial [Jatropha curcas]|uniref:pentatricopeptide repeat-containing protein At4g35850, mitochondrial n=1 Tax=Jatropha curcas TaxID=180498 RepID=UPI001895492A|nr:pentatricopeptide repeat-containing protein At4g35850, mitochondrial [Jatropha curcas]